MNVSRSIRFLCLFFLFTVSCAQSGKDDFAGWDRYEHPDGRFSFYYLSPPWTTCNETEFEEYCHECPGHLIGQGRCGGASNWMVFWIPPALLDTAYLLIPPFKFEVTWFNCSALDIDLARQEQNVMRSAGLDIIVEPRNVTLHDGTLAAEVGYEGPAYLVNGDIPANRPDEREYRVAYISQGGSCYRIGMDSAIDITLPEVRDMMSSFSVGTGEAP